MGVEWGGKETVSPKVPAEKPRTEDTFTVEDLGLLPPSSPEAPLSDTARTAGGLSTREMVDHMVRIGRSGPKAKPVRPFDA